jgi:type IV secretory pathway VirB9-like protein
MKRMLCLSVLLMLSGCVPKEEPLPPVPPTPLDLHVEKLQDAQTWTPPQTIPDAVPPLVVPPALPPAKPNEARYLWQEGTEYEVPVQIGWPVDVQFEPGEILAVDVDGDRAPLGEHERRWQKVEGTSRQEWGKDKQQAHIFFTCTHISQKQGVVVATSRRMYYLSMKCVAKSPVRVVRWDYPPEAQLPPPVPPPRILPDPAQVQRYQVGYEISTPEGFESYRPVWVGNDKEHIYMIFPPTLLAEQAPMVREISAQGPTLVNSRQPAGKPVVIVDGLSPRLELRYGEGEEAPVITITRGNLQVISCPGAPQCPLWP